MKLLSNAWAFIAVLLCYANSEGGVQGANVRGGSGTDAGARNGDGQSVMQSSRGSKGERNLQSDIVGTLHLINAITEAKLTSLTDGQVIVVSDISGMTTPNFNINATFTNPSAVQSVVFGHNSNPSVRSDGTAPFSFCGNQGPLFNTCETLTYGVHTVTATPNTGPSVSVTFTIEKTAAAPTPIAVAPVPVPVPVPMPVPVPVPVPTVSEGISALRLVYTGSPSPHQSVVNLVLGGVNVVDLAALNLPKAAFNVDAARTSTKVKSVVFSNNRPDNGAPFSFCGNSGENYNTCDTLSVGSTTTVSVTSYPLTNQKGTPFPTVSATIQIIDSRVTPTAAPQPMPSPIATPPSPTPPSSCSIPKLPVGGNGETSWQNGKPYPITVSEAQGAMIGTTLVVSSGFKSTWEYTTPETYSLDTSNPNANWQRLDDQPVSLAITHAGFVVVGTKFYMCGGYKGGNEGPTTNTCLVLDISKPSGQQWDFIAPLPNLGQAGGGMVYDSTLNALIYAGGALRIKGQSTVDLDNTWMYSFDNAALGWQSRAPIPFKANHMSFTTVGSGSAQRHFFVGGQQVENEAQGNVVHHYEYLAATNTWTQHKSMPFPRGHTSSSTRPVGCGYIMVGGTGNGWKRSRNVTYYDIPTNEWTKIGDLPYFGINTPVCDINRGTNMLYCETGGLTYTYSYKTQLLV